MLEKVVSQDYFYSFATPPSFFEGYRYISKEVLKDD